jgi:hypothetical protein
LLRRISFIRIPSCAHFRWAGNCASEFEKQQQRAGHGRKPDDAELESTLDRLFAHLQLIPPRTAPQLFRIAIAVSTESTTSKRELDVFPYRQLRRCGSQRTRAALRLAA